MEAIEKVKWSIIGLSEVRRQGEKIEDYGEFILYYKGVTPGRYGVGFIIKSNLKEHIMEIIGISDRIAVLNICIPPHKEEWSILQIYSPTEQSSNSEIEAFYTELNSCIKEHTHKNIIVMGDFNAKLGYRRDGEETILGPYSTGIRSRNGEKLVEIAYENNLKILNSLYKKRKERKWTWISPDGRYKNEIDFILTNRSTSFDDCSTLNNINFNSNHRMVRAKLRMDNASKKKRPFILESVQPSGIPNIGDIKTELTNFIEANKTSNIQSKYNKLQELLTMREKKDITTDYNRANSNISETTRQLMDSRAKLIGLENKTKNIRKEIGRLSKEINKNIRKERERRRQGLFEKYITTTGGIKKAIKYLKDRSEWIPNMKDGKGKCKTRRLDILKIATNFYEDLYKNRQGKTIETTFINDSESDVPNILEREVEKAIETQKRDKAPGPDRITNNLLLEIKEYITPVLTNMFNEILANEEIPKQWSESVITLLHKKGDKNNINNYRPISLMSNIYKIFAKVILQRITRTLDENQPREQAGFRSGYSTLDHIIVVKQIFEKSKEFNTPFYCCFIDYSKAFDSINHNDIWQALIHQGVEPKYIRIIKNIYKNSTAKIKLERDGTEINIERGVRQGDPLSPKLFSAVLEQVFRNINWENCGLTINGETLSHLRFADDIILFAPSIEQLQDMVHKLQKESIKVGLTVNTEKTKAMTNWEIKPLTDVNNTSIEYVNEYTYLGQLISPTDMMQKEIETRIGNAWKRYWSLKEVMKNKEISIHIKKKLYNTCILPVLTYGCQTWSLTKNQIKKLEVCQRAMERSMLNKKRADKIRNETLRKTTKIEDVTVKVKRLKWRWTGHILRGIEKWNKVILNWYPRMGKRKKGRQFKRWVDEIKVVAGPTWTRLGRDRERWKQMEEAFCLQGKQT